MKNKILGIAFVVLGIMMISGVMADICETEPWRPECGGGGGNPCTINPTLPECGGSGGGGTFCDMNPTDPSCNPQDPCLVNPTLCSGYDPCLAQPSLPQCSGSGGGGTSGGGTTNWCLPVGNLNGLSCNIYTDTSQGACESHYTLWEGSYRKCFWMPNPLMQACSFGEICTPTCTDTGCPNDRFCDILTPTYQCELRCPDPKTIWSGSIGDCVSRWIDGGNKFSHEEGRLTKASCMIKNDGTGVWYQDYSTGAWYVGNNYDVSGFPTRKVKYTCDGNDVVMNYEYETPSSLDVATCQKIGAITGVTTYPTLNLDLYADNCIQSGLRVTYSCVGAPTRLFADIAIDLSCQ